MPDFNVEYTNDNVFDLDLEANPGFCLQHDVTTPEWPDSCECPAPNIIKIDDCYGLQCRKGVTYTSQPIRRMLSTLME